MMASPQNLAPITINSKWIWQGGHPALSITPVSAADSASQLSPCLTPLATATITPLMNVTPILPTQPIPQAFIQTVISSSTDVTPLTEIVSARKTQINTVTSSNISVTSSDITVTPSDISVTPPSVVSVEKVGSDPCATPVVTLSMKELRNKGSSFLRTHASKHGIPNASRKLTAQVLSELCQHYHIVHKVPIILDDEKEGGAQTKTPIKLGKKRPSSNGEQISPTIPPKQHLLSSNVQQQLKGGLTQINNIVEQELMPKAELKPVTELPMQPTKCCAEILVQTRAELAACGTSILRPEAAAHKVHNASRKPKEIVVEELWQHYLEFHGKDFKNLTEPGWVGRVVDDDDDGIKK